MNDRWELWKPTVKELREIDSRQPPIYVHFEALADALGGKGAAQQRLRQRAIKWLVKSLTY